VVTADFLLRMIPLQNPLSGLFADIVPIDPKGGGGVWSVVFAARHIPTGAKVALKFVVFENDLYRRDSFVREGQLLETKLKSERHFVQLIEPPSVTNLVLNVTVPPGVPLNVPCPYLAFEWIPDGTLEKHCSPTIGYLDLVERLRLFREACRVVNRLHFLGCAHRDLKPGNFFISGSAVKLGDFGTSRTVSPPSPHLRPSYSGPVGDMRYLGPEVLAGIGDDDFETQRRGDAYSLGAILFELLTGQMFYAHAFKNYVRFKRYTRAIPGDIRPDAVHQFLDSTHLFLPNWRAVNPNIPKCVAPLLDTVLERLSAHDYRDRISNINDIHNILRICELVLIQEAKARHIICADPKRRRKDAYV